MNVAQWIRQGWMPQGVHRVSMLVILGPTTSPEVARVQRLFDEACERERRSRSERVP